jgi:hypothetical protein
VTEATVAAPPGTEPRARTPRPRLPTVVGLIALAAVPFVALHLRLSPVDDPDAFWHVLSGQHVWESHRVIVQDPFGHFSTNTWVQIDWLTDLAMAGVYAVGGLAGVAWMYTALSIVLFGVLYVGCRAHAAPLLAGVAALGGWAGTFASQGFRPQTVSFILLGVVLITWRRVQQGSPTTPWWLIALNYVWACSHGLWFLGPLVGLTVVVGMAFDGRLTRSRLLTLLAIPVASVVAAALTPIGPGLLTAPFTVNGYAPLVSEWRPPDIHEPYVAATVILLAITALGWARAKSAASWADYLMWGMALGWTLLYARTVAVGAVIAAPLAAMALASLVPVSEDPAGRRLERVLLPVAAITAIVVAAFAAPSLAGRADNMPTPIDAEISRLAPGTVVFNDDGAGGWMLLEHPQLRPIIDTRTYLFDIPYIREYIRARGASGDWQSFIKQTGATTAVLRADEPLIPALERELGWTERVRRGGWVLLAAPSTP